MKPCSSLIAVLPPPLRHGFMYRSGLMPGGTPSPFLHDFRFHWKEEYQGNRPDSMGVIAVRPVNILRYEFRITAEESHNNGILMQPETERQPSADTLAPAGTHNLWVRSGEYNFATFGWDEGELVDATDIVDTQGDAATLGSGLTPLYLTYRHYPGGRSESGGGRMVNGRITTLNSDFISSEGVPVFYARVDHVSVPLAQEGTGQVVVDFTPEPLTQDVSFVFHIEKTADVVVDSLTAEISGIPSTMELTTGLILAQKTYKLLFRPTYAALPSAADSASAEALRCEASVNIPGIVRTIPKTWSRAGHPANRHLHPLRLRRGRNAKESSQSVPCRHQPLPYLERAQIAAMGRRGERLPASQPKHHSGNRLTTEYRQRRYPERWQHLDRTGPMDTRRNV